MPDERESTIYPLTPYVPETVIDSLTRYIEDGVPTGDFLRAVLMNDLFGAAARADAFNRPYLANIASWVYENVPMGAYGSKDMIEYWIQRGGRSRIGTKGHHA